MIAVYAALCAAWGQQPAEVPSPEAPPAESPSPEAPPVEAPSPEAPAEAPPAEEIPVEELPVEELPVEAPPIEAPPAELSPPLPDPSLEVPSEDPAAGAELIELPPWRVRPRRFGVNVEYGWLANRDPAYDVFAERNGMRSFGFGANYRLARNLAVVGAWHHVRQGADVHIGGADTDTDFQDDQQSFRAALVANEMTLGARLDAPIEGIFFPFVSAQGELVTTWTRFDDVLDDRENPSQAEAQGVHMGGLFTGGAELRLVPESRVQASFTMEFGYAWLSRSELDAFGEMKPGGFAFRLGWGIRL